MSPIIDPFEKVRDITQAWEAHAPQSIFSGFTLEKFKETVQPHLDVRNQLAHVETLAMGLRAKRATGSVDCRKLTDRITAGVRADPEHGPDSAMWAAMGFVRVSDRGTGLTRKGRGKSSQSNGGPTGPTGGESSNSPA